MDIPGTSSLLLIVLLYFRCVCWDIVVGVPMWSSDKIVSYVCERWPKYKTRSGSRYVRGVVRSEFKAQRESGFVRSDVDIAFDTLMRVTQIFECS